MSRGGAGLAALLMLLSAVGNAFELTGEGVQGGLLQGRVDPGSTVRVDGRPIRVSPEGVFLLGFGRDDTAALEVDVTGLDGSHERRSITPRAREYDIQRIDGLPSRKVQPRQSDLKRIRRDAALVATARRGDDARTDFLVAFQWPARGRVSGVYGSQRVLNGKPRRPHFGLDVAAPVGTPVVAPAAGIVTLAEPDLFFSGGTLILDHGHGLSSSFLHLSRLLVSKGQRVEQGDPIAEIGATGRVTGAHLDWRINLLDKRLDPALLVGPMPATD